MSKKPELQKGDPETTGHVWDGIQEFNNPLPRWWVWVFYLTIIWGIGYTIAYPAWPLINGATPGVLGWSTRADVQTDIDAVNEANAAITARLAAAELTEVESDAELNGFAVSSGAAVFRTWCAQCHGSGAAGAKGYPNLLDDDWLWGGDIEAIHTTVSYGIRTEDNDDSRYSEMPAFGDMLEPEEISQVVNYVQTLSGGTANDPALAEAGAVVFGDNCSSCHADNGTGDRDQGAPNLTDAIWLFGGDYETLTESVRDGRFGVMPHWTDRLTEAQIRAVSLYVHQLGGGE